MTGMVDQSAIILRVAQHGPDSIQFRISSWQRFAAFGTLALLFRNKRELQFATSCRRTPFRKLKSLLNVTSSMKQDVFVTSCNLLQSGAYRL